MLTNVVFRGVSGLCFVLAFTSSVSVAGGSRLRETQKATRAQTWPFSDDTSDKPKEAYVVDWQEADASEHKETAAAEKESHPDAAHEETKPSIEEALRKRIEQVTASNKAAEAKPASFTNFKQILHNFQNVQYFADFKIGGQHIAGIFDTGSFELLVRSSKCEACVHPTPPYDAKKSGTFTKNGTMTQHVFGSGPCMSSMGFDDVSVGPLVSKQQAFWEIVQHQIPVLDQAKFAAIVGIGPNFAFGNTEKTLLMSFGIDEFSICLQRETGADGYLTWGPTLVPISFDVATAAVIGKHHWAARLHDVTFVKPMAGNHLSQLPCGGETGCVAIVDSGTSLIAAPGLALMQLSEQIPPINEDCSNLHELPTLHFQIDGNNFELPPQAYVMRVTGATLEANDIWDILFFKPKIRKVNMCMPAFMQLDMMSQFGPVWILGMPFFRYYHTTFDRVSQTLRFATAGPGCEPLPYVKNGSPKQTGQTSNHTESLLGVHKGEAMQPMDVDIAALMPPTLSGMMDFPFATGGVMDL